MADLVRGEASESDEEVHDIQKIFAAEVAGEASEEDDDEDEDIYEQRGGASQAVAMATSTASIYRNNLLQRKLIENNIAVWRSLTGLTRSFVVNASKQLLNTDQMLIKSQVSLQSAHTALQHAQQHMDELQTKTSAVLAGSSFLPHINIKIS
ncbi:uncharacterized protein Dwil_GK20441 [Drosophila willistoni]|uniref:Biogenesis of lysosome-related organelles complex 1 subunit 3 n=1 Tax=Drosophila willistoni TaxID=7260 RepID=B4N4U9_DROWI|nr:biogenesis of lysosome-related organelles complex 1 subunit 3 [Drosophila willistoni]EDW79388.1 uncharacterized protein Dwil_GK20441 [Drosophila willistoni]